MHPDPRHTRAAGISPPNLCVTPPRPSAVCRKHAGTLSRRPPYSNFARTCKVAAKSAFSLTPGAARSLFGADKKRMGGASPLDKPPCGSRIPPGRRPAAQPFSGESPPPGRRDHRPPADAARSFPTAPASCPGGKRTGPGPLPGARAYAMAGLLLAMQRLHALLVVQNGLAHPQALGGDLQQLVVRQELQTLLQAHDLRRNKL